MVKKQWTFLFQGHQQCPDWGQCSRVTTVTHALEPNSSEGDLVRALITKRMVSQRVGVVCEVLGYWLKKHQSSIQVNIVKHQGALLVSHGQNSPEGLEPRFVCFGFSSRLLNRGIFCDLARPKLLTVSCGSRRRGVRKRKHIFAKNKKEFVVFFWTTTQKNTCWNSRVLNECVLLSFAVAMRAPTKFPCCAPNGCFPFRCRTNLCGLCYCRSSYSWWGFFMVSLIQGSACSFSPSHRKSILSVDRTCVFLACCNACGVSLKTFPFKQQENVHFYFAGKGAKKYWSREQTVV